MLTGESCCCWCGWVVGCCGGGAGVVAGLRVRSSFWRFLKVVVPAVGGDLTEQLVSSHPFLLLPLQLTTPPQHIYITHNISPTTTHTQGSSLLSQLGLSDDAIRSTMMTRDIVPRAFSCDYTLVADLLRSWGPSWREHSCLAGGATGTGRRQMYLHIGRMHVLQPSPELPFITERAGSFLPLLPQKPELFALQDRPSLSHAMDVARSRAAAVRNGKPVGQPAVSRDEVLAAIMDCPHPLETLADAAAYGNSGSISRYHNPDHYCMALGKVLRDRRQEEAQQLGRPFDVPQRAALFRPFFPAAAASVDASVDDGVDAVVSAANNAARS